MRCSNCGEEIKPTTDTRYESVTPVEGGGQTTTEYCSVACLNEDASFTEDEIKSMMREANYEVSPDIRGDWVAHLNSEIGDLGRHSNPTPGEYFVLYCHVEKNYDIEVFHEANEKLYEVVLYEYERDEDDNKVGLVEVDKEYTAVHQRAIAYAEGFMRRVDEM